MEYALNILLAFSFVIIGVNMYFFDDWRAFFDDFF